ADAANYKGVSYFTVSRLVRRGELPALRIGRQALIARADLDAWQPMRDRAPKQHRRNPNPAAAPLITGEVRVS
ncbi:MAG: helix-turn-helix domain-containing protein, partial [Desulfurellales bacterium]